MKPFKLLILFTFLSLGLFSCKKEHTTVMIDQSAEKLLIGKWALRQERFTQYIDTQKHVDTTFNTTVYSVASIQFNSDGTFVSANAYSNGETDPGTFTGGSISSGMYTFDGNTFGLSNSIEGLKNGVAFFGGTIISGTAPVITPVSHLAQISLLTTTRLNLHTEFVYTYSGNGAPQTYKMTDDYYYSK